MIAVVLIYSVTVVAQKTKPIVITKPNTTFLKTLEQNAKSISPKVLKGLTANEKSFITLLKTATTASGWDKAAYKTFAKTLPQLLNH